MRDLIEHIDEYVAPDGERYAVDVYGRTGADGMWEGWLEFVPIARGDTLPTEVETEQSSREDLEYWASGLTDTYFEGAIERAREDHREKEV
ncbi:MAG TPA: hypothetical protein VFI91_02480 [Longimicrobiaceae bacterium]|nr:hypothetical protein [Longimicrobiaceae bacterium]